MSDLKSIKDYNILCNLLDLSIDKFYEVLNLTKNNGGYSEFKVAKKSGSFRLISAPIKLVKFVQTKITQFLQEYAQPHSSAFGFIKKKSNVLNAKQHYGKRWCFNLDLKDFFQSITFARVYGLLMSKPFYANKKIATALAIILTHKKRLPQGAPSSPYISNLIAFKLDVQLKSLANKYKCTYTRYADDITFSSNAPIFPEEIAYYDSLFSNWYIGKELLNIIKRNSFIVNTAKVRMAQRYKHQEVTGIVVNEKLNLSREYYRELRSILYKIKKTDLDTAAKINFEIYHKSRNSCVNSLVNYINGKMAYYKTVVGEGHSSYNKLCKLYNNSISEKYTDCVYSRSELIENSIFVIEDEEKTCQGTAFLLKGEGIVTCKHCLGLNVNDFLNEDDIIVANNTQFKNFYLFRIKSPDKHYKVKVKKVYKEDLVLLEISDGINPLVAFKRSNININMGLNNITMLGFPNYAPGDSINEQRGIQITSTKNYFDAVYYVINCSVVAGNSGGPILDELNNVIGIACRGGKNFEDAYKNGFNAFLSITLL